MFNVPIATIELEGCIDKTVSLKVIVAPDKTFNVIVVPFSKLMNGILSGCGARLLLGTIKISGISNIFSYVINTIDLCILHEGRFIFILKFNIIFNTINKI